MGNVYRSNYNGLQVTLNARNYHGLSMVAGYTYSHALDDVGANWDFGYGSGLPQNAHNPGAEYANSDFDMRHRLTISLTYAIPGRKGYGQMAGRLGDQHDHHPGNPAVLGPDGRGNRCGRRWTVAHQPSRQQLRFAGVSTARPRTSSLRKELDCRISRATTAEDPAAVPLAMRRP